MKHKTIATLSFLVVTSFSISSFAKRDVLCEKKRERVAKSVCAKSSNEEKRQECVAFYKNESCGTVALHESYNEQ